MLAAKGPPEPPNTSPGWKSKTRAAGAQSASNQLKRAKRALAGSMMSPRAPVSRTCRRNLRLLLLGHLVPLLSTHFEDPTLARASKMQKVTHFFRKNGLAPGAIRLGLVPRLWDILSDGMNFAPCVGGAPFWDAQAAGKRISKTLTAPLELLQPFLAHDVSKLGIKV